MGGGGTLLATSILQIRNICVFFLGAGIVAHGEIFLTNRILDHFGWILFETPGIFPQINMYMYIKTIKNLPQKDLPQNSRARDVSLILTYNLFRRWWVYVVTWKNSNICCERCHGKGLSWQVPPKKIHRYCRCGAIFLRCVGGLLMAVITRCVLNLGHDVRKLDYRVLPPEAHQLIRNHQESIWKS